MVKGGERMAVTALQLTSNVVLRVKIGVDQNGRDIEKKFFAKLINNLNLIKMGGELIEDSSNGFSKPGREKCVS